MTRQSSSDQRFSLGYSPALDGLRGVAILLVMALHTHVPQLQGGFIGVDVFFVLSGFLITALLVREFDAQGRIHLPYFYARRALRLLPALFVMLLVVNVWMLAVHAPNEIAATQKDTLASLLYVSNWAYAFQILAPQYLGHTWSLAIEEQFYLLFPLLLIGLLTYVSRRCAAMILLALSAASWLWRVILIAHAAPLTWASLTSASLTTATLTRVYYSTDTRLDGLLMGAALACLLTSDAFPRAARIPPTLIRVMTAASVGVLAVIAVTGINVSALTYTVALPGVAVCVSLIILGTVIDPRGPITRALEWPPLVGLGRVSYGLYLWHAPIYQALFYALHLPPLNIAIGGTGLALAATWASYRVIEKPALRLKRRFEGGSL